MSVEPWCVSSANEELASVGIWTTVGHTEASETRVWQFEVLISEARTVDRNTTSSVEVGEVTTLAHELWDDTVEWTVLISECSSGRLGSNAKLTEVLGSLWDDVSEQFKNHSSGFPSADRDVHVDLWV